MSNPQAMLEVGVDATPSKDGFAEIKAGARDMAAAVAQEGQRAAKGVDAIGEGGQAAAAKVDRATSNLIGSIQRTTAAMEAGSRSSSKYYETLAAQRGINIDALRPYLQQLDAVAAKQTALAGCTEKLNSQLRQVGPQFTDIVTQLAGGQNAMQVFIQQGGQLKDQFGGAGNAARALGGYVGSLITPLTVVAGAAAAIGYAFYQGRQEADLLTRSLISTNGAAGKTVGQLEDIAARISTSVGTQGQAVAALAQLVGNATTATTGDLKQMAEVAVSAEKTLGRSVDQTVKDFEALGRSPVDASLKLNEQYRYLTASVFAQIRALEEQGRVTEAAALAQKTYADATQQQIGSVQQNLGTLERGWNAITGAAKSAWDAMLNVGRTDAPEQQATKLAEKIASLQAKLDRERNTANAMGPGGVNNAELIASLQAQLDTAKQQQAIAQENVRLGQRAAATAAERTRLEQAGVVWQMEGDKYLTKRQQMEREIARATQQATAAGISREEVEKRILAIKEKYTEKKSGGSTSESDGARVLSEWSRRVALIDAEVAGTEKLSATEAAYVKVLDDITSGRITLTNAEKAELAVRASAALQLDKQVQLEKDRARAVAEWSKETEKASGDLDQQISAQREQNEVLGMTGSAAKLLKAAKLDLVAATEEERAATLRANAAYAGGLEDAYRQQADAIDLVAKKHRQLADEIRSGAAREAEIESAKASAQAWQRAGEQIEQALTDALMRGFENGKDFGENFIDSLKNTIKTAALRLAVQVVVSGASSGIQSVLGAVASNGTQGAGQTGGALGAGSNLLSTASSLYGGYSSLMGAASYFQTGWAMPASQIGTTLSSGASSIANGYGAQGAGQMLGGISKVAWPLAIAYGMYMSSKAYDQGFRMDSGTYGGGAWGNFAKSATDTLTLEPLLQKIVGDRAAAILTGSSLAAKIVEGIRKKFGAGGEKVGGEAWSGPQAWDFYTPSNADGSIASSVSSLKAQIDALAKSFGGSAAGINFGLGFDADPNGKAASRTKAQLTDANGKTIYSALDVEAGRSQEELQASLGIQASRLMIAGLKASHLDDAIASIFNKLDLSTLSEKQANEALAAAAALQSFGTAISDFYSSLGETDIALGSLSNKDALAGLFGGFDALKQAVGGAYDLLMTDAEKLALAQTNLSKSFADLNLSVPASNDALRSLIKAQDITTESGLKTYAALINLTPAFVQVTNAASEAAKTAAAAAQEAAAQAAAAAQKAAFDSLNGFASSYFAALDAEAARVSLSGAGASAIDALFGSLESAADSASAAASNAAQEWAAAASSIQSTLESLRTGPLSTLSPEERYAQLKAQFQTTSVLAQAGDATSAAKLGAVAQSFLEASKDYNASSSAYQADRAAVESQLSKTLVLAQGNSATQDAIASATRSSASSLTELTGFAKTALEVLQKGGYTDRGSASQAVDALAKLQSVQDSYFATSKAGDVWKDASVLNGQVTRLDNGMAAIQWASGITDYMRQGESVVDIAKRIPALRAIWEKMYGIKLPAYATGTPMVQGDQVAQIHHGEMILNTADSNVLRKYGIPTQPDPGLLREVIAELKAARQVQQSGFDVSARRLADLASRLEALESETRQVRLSAERGV